MVVGFPCASGISTPDGGFARHSFCSAAKNTQVEQVWFGLTQVVVQVAIPLAFH